MAVNYYFRWTIGTCRYEAPCHTTKDFAEHTLVEE